MPTSEPILQPQGPVIEADGVSVKRMYSPGIAVEDVHWQVAAGEYWVVGGRHGTGKSAFLATLAGLHPAAAGVVRHFGRDISEFTERESVEQRKRVGFVFKGGGRMFVDMTVAENITLPLRYHRDWTDEEAAASVETLLETTELTALARSTAQSLTTGWQQRVGLARALALQPEVLFLDEPMAGLEAGHRQWWRTFLEQLSNGAACAQGRKMTLIAATSDFTLWGPGHKFARLKDGHWESLGERADIPEMN